MILIYAEARTGSSNLLRSIMINLFNRVYDIEAPHFEPFKNKKPRKSSLPYIIKHIGKHCGPEDNRYLLNKYEKIILLTRDCVENQALSWAIASKTKLWRFSKEHQENMEYKKDDIPEVNQVEWRIKYLNSSKQYALNTLKNKEYFHVTYEQLYATSPYTRTYTLINLLKFCDGGFSKTMDELNMEFQHPKFCQRRS
jgi:hypothetical protein